MIKNKIKKYLQDSISELGIEYNNIIIQDPRNHEDVDYATNVAILLSKELKKPPADIASDIIANIKNSEFFDNIIIAVAAIPIFKCPS